MSMRTITGRYPWIIVMIVQVITVALFAGVIIFLTERAIHAERTARQESAEQSRRATCVVVAAQDAAYEDTPPTSPAGINVAAAWHSLNQSLHCDK